MVAPQALPRNIDDQLERARRKHENAVFDALEALGEPVDDVLFIKRGPKQASGLWVGYVFFVPRSVERAYTQPMLDRAIEILTESVEASLRLIHGDVFSARATEQFVRVRYAPTGELNRTRFGLLFEQWVRIQTQQAGVRFRLEPLLRDKPPNSLLFDADHVRVLSFLPWRATLPRRYVAPLSTRVFSSWGDLASEGGPDRWLRWTMDPTLDLQRQFSINYQTGRPENGLSVVPLPLDGKGARQAAMSHVEVPGDAWVFLGRRTGTGSDGEPVIFPEKIIGVLADRLADEVAREVIDAPEVEAVTA